MLNAHLCGQGYSNTAFGLSQAFDLIRACRLVAGRLVAGRLVAGLRITKIQNQNDIRGHWRDRTADLGVISTTL